MLVKLFNEYHGCEEEKKLDIRFILSNNFELTTNHA